MTTAACIETCAAPWQGWQAGHLCGNRVDLQRGRDTGDGLWYGDGGEGGVATPSGQRGACSKAARSSPLVAPMSSPSWHSLPTAAHSKLCQKWHIGQPGWAQARQPSPERHASSAQRTAPILLPLEGCSKREGTAVAFLMTRQDKTGCAGRGPGRAAKQRHTPAVAARRAKASRDARQHTGHGSPACRLLSGSPGGLTSSPAARAPG